MIRFLLGVIVGALGGLYFLGIFLSSSTESTGAEFPSVWGTNTDDNPQWTWTSYGTPLT